MQELRAKTFSISVPDTLESTTIGMELLRAETANTPYVLRNPEITVLLTEIADYAKRPGASLFERFLSSVYELDERTERLGRHDMLVNGRPSLVQEARGLASWDEREAQVHYLLGLVPISDAHCYIFKACCEADVADSYRGLFLEIWQTLRWFGDPKGATEERAATLRAALKDPDPPPNPEIKPFTPPVDGKGVFRLDGYDLALSPASNCAIAQGTRTLSIEVRANPDPALPNHADLIDDVYAAEALGFDLTFSAVHRRGVPTGELVFHAGQPAQRLGNIRNKGWHYALKFTGVATLRDGWLGLNGHLSDCDSDQSPRYALEVCLPLDLAALDWSHYLFTSLDEIEGADTGTVRFLSLTGPDFEVPPPEVLALDNLEELTISSGSSVDGDQDPMPLRDLTEGLGELSRLKSLHIHGANLTSLPSSLCRLDRLESLSITGTALTTTPDALWLHPRLKYLALSHNRLTALPAECNLPALKTLHLNDNALTALPRGIAQFPQLSQLALGRNPWVSLDQDLLRISRLDLDLEERLRLFDCAYPGADESGVVAWDDEQYFARSDAGLSGRFVSRLEAHGYAQHRDALLQLARKTLFFMPEGQDDYANLGNTRFGGWPDLPASIPYPRFERQGKRYAYEFLAQIDCAQVAHLQDYLPRTGILYFFLDDDEQPNGIVRYFDGDLSELRSGREIDLSADDFYDMADPPHIPYRAMAQIGWSLPSDYSSRTNSYLFKGASASLLEEDDLLYNISEALAEDGPAKAHAVNSHVFTQHESPELQAALRKRGRPEDWVVLLNLASLGDFQWWDAGEFFFVIHKSDLEKRDFSNLYCGLESS